MGLVLSCCCPAPSLQDVASGSRCGALLCFVPVQGWHPKVGTPGVWWWDGGTLVAPTPTPAAPLCHAPGEQRGSGFVGWGILAQMPTKSGPVWRFGYTLPPSVSPTSAPTHEGPHGWILAPRILRVAEPLAPSDCAPHQSPVLAKPSAAGRYSELIIRQMLLRNVSPSASRALAALRRIGSMEPASCENLCLFLGGKKSQTLPDLNVSAREKL